MQAIDIEHPSQKFEEHLKIENNFRIIVSGEFGIGKTFFLNKFFDSRKDEYNKIVISPVNYVLSSNEDIFELIKADIIYNLFFNHIGIPASKKKKTIIEKIDLFCGENPHHLFKFITSTFKKVNPFFEVVDSFFESYKEIKRQYDDYVKDLDDTIKDSSETLGEYLSTFWDMKGNLFEQDFITQTINSKLKEIQKGNKKNVLIIDDLDRIDPEHIFRILNILSAHNNHLGKSNKFNFQHIIIVCDIDNIRRMYQHRYGEKVDFEGYVDKFYSSDIFFFSNDDAIESYVDSLEYKSNSVYESHFLKFIFKSLNSNGLTVRRLIKLDVDIALRNEVIYEQIGVQEKLMIQDNRPLWFKNNVKLQLLSTDLSILRFFKIVSILYGDFSTFLQKLKIIEKGASLNDVLTTNSEVVIYLAFQFHLLSSKEDSLFFSKSYLIGGYDNSRYAISRFDYPSLKKGPLFFRFNLSWFAGNPYDGSRSYFESMTVECNKSQKGASFSEKDIFNLLIEIIHICKNKKLFKLIGVRELLTKE